jgi:hypothetical protein
MRALLSLIILVAGLGSAAAESIDIGPAVGAAIPKPFVVHDPAGAVSNFDDLTGPKGAVLVPLLHRAAARHAGHHRTLAP